MSSTAKLTKFYGMLIREIHKRSEGLKRLKVEGTIYDSRARINTLLRSPGIDS